MKKLLLVTMGLCLSVGMSANITPEFVNAYNHTSKPMTAIIGIQVPAGSLETYYIVPSNSLMKIRIPSTDEPETVGLMAEYRHAKNPHVINHLDCWTGHGYNYLQTGKVQSGTFDWYIEPTNHYPNFSCAY